MEGREDMEGRENLKRREMMKKRMLDIYKDNASLSSLFFSFHTLEEEEEEEEEIIRRRGTAKPGRAQLISAHSSLKLFCITVPVRPYLRRHLKSLQAFET